MKNVQSATRQVKVDHQNPVRFSELSEEQKTKHNMFAATLVAYCSSHICELIPWADIDRYVPHIYGFIFENYNACHQKTQMVFNEKGVMCIKVRQVK